MAIQRCCYTTLSPLRYQGDLQIVLYFLYGALFVQVLGAELTVIFTYFYLHYLEGGMMSILLAVAHGTHFIRSYWPTGGRRTILRMHANGIGALLLDVRLPPYTTLLVTPLTVLFF